MTDRPVLVICYGNELRRDDGAGWVAGRRLGRRLPPEAASVLMAHQLLPELSQQISGAGFVIFIDADATLPPGQVKKQVVTAGPAGGSLGHHQSPQGLLLMAKRLYSHSPAAMIYSIGGADFTHGRGLSNEVRQGLATLVEEVIETVKSALLPHCGVS